MKIPRQILMLVTALLSLIGSSLHAHAFYDPTVGRWLNRDPLGEMGFEITLEQISSAPPVEFAEILEDATLYRFVANNPLNVADIDGRTGWQFTDAFGRPLPQLPPANPGPMIGPFVGVCLIVGDCILGGPTGEGICPAMAIMGGKEALKKVPAFKRWFHKYWKPKNKTPSKEKKNPDVDVDEGWDEWRSGGGRNIK